MNGGDILFDALNGVSDCFVLEAGDLLRIGEEVARTRKGKALENGAACRGARAAARCRGLCCRAAALEGSDIFH